MTLPNPLTPEPERMTRRAQVYLVIASLRHLAVGLYCLLAPAYFTNPSYNQIRAILPLRWWSVTFLLAAVTCISAAARKSDWQARLGLILSAGSTGMWAGGFVAAALHGQLTGPTSVIVWVALTGKDLVVCRQPMRSPFEPLVRRVLRQQQRDETADVDWHG